MAAPPPLTGALAPAKGPDNKITTKAALNSPLIFMHVSKQNANSQRPNRANLKLPT